MKYAYPAIFTPEDDKILVSVPDLPGLHTFGDDLPDAIYMAQDALEMWLWDAENEQEAIPQASTLAAMNCGAPGQFASMVAADTDEYRRQIDSRSVKKTLSIPSWLNYQAEKANAPFSHILQQGLKSYLNV
jgi:predicted RNase H-like HicB family nuclease